jgi:colanic acid/amylovoran biosynthesis glycosyltransferase
VRVTFCSYDKPNTVGGPVTWIRRLLPDLQARGIDVNCLFLIHCGTSGPAVEALRRREIPISAIECPPYIEDQVEWILRELQSDPPDVFVPNLVLAGLVASRWVRAAGIPTVGVIHSDDSYYRGVLDEFVFGKETSRLDAVVCVSREIEKQVIEKNDVGVTVRAIPCGVPIPPHRVQRDPARLRLAYVGRLADEQKRITDLTRAFCRVTREVPGIEALIVGEGPDKSKVERVIADEHNDRVTLSEPVDVDRVQTLLLERDVIVLLSDYEGLPIALMEGMACGCVPITLKVRSGIPELVENEKTGLIVEDRDGGFTDAVRRLRNDPSLWEALSTRGRTKIEDGYSRGLCADMWKELLTSIGAHGRPRRAISVPTRMRILHRNPALDMEHQMKPRTSRLISAYKRARVAIGAIRRVLAGRAR